MTSLSRFLDIGLGSSPDRREKLAASQALTITPVTGTYTATHKHTLPLPASLSHCHTATHNQPDTAAPDSR